MKRTNSPKSKSLKSKSTSNPNADSSITSYFAALLEPARTTLQSVRADILSACPKGTTEALSYGLPTFKHKGSVLAIAAFKNHCSLFPMSYFVIDKFRSQLASFEISKGTVRFPIDKPIPAPLLKKIVKARLTQMAEKAKAKSKSKPPR